MEAVEFAASEPGASGIPTIRATAQDVLDGHDRPEAVLDFCPRFQAEISLSAPMLCVEATDVMSGSNTLVPAETIFYPALADEQSLFGATTNGLAAGNTLLEATLHALCEVVERDISSFHLVSNTTSLVDSESFPESARWLHGMIADAGLDLYVRYQSNEFELPCFSAVVADRSHPGAIKLHGGFGCHPHRDIALIRAITEAAQSRLGFIHGGRDDLVMDHQLVEGKSDEEIQQGNVQAINRHAASDRAISFDDVADYSPETGDIQACFDFLSALLLDHGFRWILRAVLTQEFDPVQVVRVVVPRMELFAKHIARVGPRLGEFANNV